MRESPREQPKSAGFPPFQKETLGLKVTEPGQALDARDCRAQEEAALAPPAKPLGKTLAHRVRVEPLGISSLILQPQLPHLRVEVETYFLRCIRQAHTLATLRV